MAVTTNISIKFRDSVQTVAFLLLKANSYPTIGRSACLETHKIYGKGTGQVDPMQPIRPWIAGEIGVFAAM